MSPLGASIEPTSEIRSPSTFLPGLEKQKVLNKFFEVSTMQSPVRRNLVVSKFDSSKVTAAIVNQVTKEHRLI